jgi:hypothetical protein
MATAQIETVAQQRVAAVRRQRHIVTAVVAASVVVFAAALGLALWRLVQAWQTWESQDWAAFWQAADFVQGALFLWLAVTTFRRASQLEWFSRYLEKSLYLLRAALDADERIAPLAADQPLLAPAPASSVEPVVLGPFLYPVTRWRVYVLRGVLIALVLLGVGALSIALLGGERFAAFSPLSGPDYVARGLLLGLGLLLWLFALTFVVWTAAPVLASLTRPLFVRWMRVIVDTDEVRRGRGAWGHKRPPLHWNEAKAFFVMRGPRRTSRSQLAGTYTLHTGAVSLSWAVSGHRSRELADHKRLCSLILERTGLPLRDISAEYARLAEEARPVRIRAWTVAAPMLLTALLYGLGYILQGYQAHYGGAIDAALAFAIHAPR